MADDVPEERPWQTAGARKALIYLFGILAAVLAGVLYLAIVAGIRGPLGTALIAPFAKAMVDYLVMPIAAVLSLSPVLPYVALALVGLLGLLSVLQYLRMMWDRGKPETIDLR